MSEAFLLYAACVEALTKWCILSLSQLGILLSQKAGTQRGLGKQFCYTRELEFREPKDAIVLLVCFSAYFLAE